MTAFSLCDACKAPLSAWEENPCVCVKSRPTTNTEIAYAIAVATPTPLHLRDFVRLADVDFDRVMPQPTANATISPNPTFCWGGKGIYGLFRHGPLPGPRNLEEAARLLLTAADQPLTLEAIEFCLKKFNYRFRSASLTNAIARSPTIEWTWHDGHFRIPATADRDRVLLRDIPVVPYSQRQQWEPLREFIAAFVEAAIQERSHRLREVNRRRMTTYGWD